MKDSQPIKILRLGGLQSGKTSGAVKESFSESQKNKNLINIFIAHKTNVNKDNQELHINKIYKKINLLKTANYVATFTAHVEQNLDMFSNGYQYAYPVWIIIIS